ncbi:hypothetical protein U0035_02405 [Niabella yanshanensis]|uniref:Uncharacterized protein n=1 Tax=Niabella yanshanensis TaxID=577386 RepID=A0ABZ0W919_9BACT|nr:hypothetical protein [Niabella yanshanensis]WQD38997.1 hypothetical protein U0035_02405 [Niabella yanshanensis]
MEHYFELPLKYREEDRMLKGRLVTFAYSYKFYIIIDGKELVFERDDEHNFRVVATESHHENMIDRELLAHIIEALERRAA